MDPAKLESLVTPRTVAILPTHHWGFVCDLDPVIEIAARHGIKVIEDCAQAPGATYHGRPVGSIGDLGCFSITGSNYRLSELESAVNVVQMQKLPDVIARHRRVWGRIRWQLGRYREIEWQKSNDPDGDIGYLLRFFPADDVLGGKLGDALRAEGIGAGYRGSEASPDWHVCRYHYPILGEELAHRLATTCPVATDLYDRCLAVGLNQWWSDEDADAVVAGINKVLTAYCTPESK